MTIKFIGGTYDGQQCICLYDFGIIVEILSKNKEIYTKVLIDNSVVHYVHN